MPSKSSAAKNADRLKKETDVLLGFDVVIDASGAEPSAQTAMHALRVGGSYVQGGIGKDEMMFPIMMACLTGLKVDVKPLISGTVKFEDAKKAFEDVKKGVGIKTLIRGPARE